MGEIKILEKDLQEKIAAGEVIERPSSVVKELIENSLDSGANQIIIEIVEGGLVSIIVRDNGGGMDKEDASLCIKAHATSKIKKLDDLFKVSTLGFRGEALASIATISNIEIITSTGEIGTKIIAEAGELKTKETIGSSKGTIVKVTDLFYNTPARKKHMKAPRVEQAKILDLITRFSLRSKDISFKLISNGKVILLSPPSENFIDKIVHLYGKETAKQMMVVEYQDNFVKITGVISKPYMTKNDRSYQTLFVNGRYVKSKTVTNAISDAYHTLLFLDRHALTVLFVEIDFSKTDVNVHPQKEIIRIENEDALYKGVFAAIKKTFQENSLIPDLEAEASEARYRKPTKQYSLLKEEQTTLETNISLNNSESNQEINYETGHKVNSGINIDLNSELNQRENIETINSKEKDIRENEIRKHKIGPIRILGQINKLYIIAEGPKGLLIIDQHAAQERVLFEKFLLQIKEKNIIKQELLKPIIVELTPLEKELYKKESITFRNLGFEIEEEPGFTIKISAYPKLFKRMEAEFFKDILTEQNTIRDQLEKEIAKKACRKAIKAGDLLTPPQMYALIDEMEKIEKPFACPHGRPTIISITLSELERKFKRVI